MKIKHVRNTNEFKDIVTNGNRITGKTVSLYKKEYPPEKGFAIGVIISKKYAGQAVIRNYIKRLTYAFFREHALPETKAAGVVIRLTKEMNGKTRKQCLAELMDDLNALTIIAGIYKNEKNSYPDA